jgi:hypothetical protein
LLFINSNEFSAALGYVIIDQRAPQIAAIFLGTRVIRARNAGRFDIFTEHRRGNVAVTRASAESANGRYLRMSGWQSRVA